MRAIGLLLCLVASAVAGVAGAQNIYRCGNTFSQAPCGPGAVTVSKPIPSAGQAASARASEPQSEAQRLERIISNSQRSRRGRELRDSILPLAETALTDHRKKCEQRQAALSSSQYAYKQNLYGKVHAAQIASEMAAEAATCDRRDRELKDNVDLLVKECAELKCR